MGSTLKNVSLVILLFKMCFAFSQKKVIVIDPGHGGKDSGAIGINGIREKDVVLNIAKEIVRLNRMVFEDEFEIYLTRYEDTLISLSDRTKLAKRLEADVFISLHCNHSDNPKARGVEVYVARTETGYLDESIHLSYALQKGFRDKLGFESRGVKFAGFQVLLEGAKSFPSVLLELGFLSNWDEAWYLRNMSDFTVVCLSILNSI
ncbi:N-acetylmuramoyl-L-alanine amidase family protein [Maribacter sp. 2308TA10-17]|uniref:N-acetylmuramoyl-L-alanine amidase family protein n=1 Tax=Maribacter sp. 2308TA10-17 TaxID=3386276 RepID=UPI0039BD0F93